MPFPCHYANEWLRNTTPGRRRENGSLRLYAEPRRHPANDQIIYSAKRITPLRTIRDSTILTTAETAFPEPQRHPGNDKIIYSLKRITPWRTIRNTTILTTAETAFPDLSLGTLYIPIVLNRRQCWMGSNGCNIWISLPEPSIHL